MSNKCPNCGSTLSRYEAEHKKCNNCDNDLSDEIASFILGVGIGMMMDSIFDSSSSSSSDSFSSDNSSSFDGFGGGDFGGGGASSDW
jgi:uncharacterized membrane protein YgcG